MKQERKVLISNTYRLPSVCWCPSGFSVEYRNCIFVLPLIQYRPNWLSPRWSYCKLACTLGYARSLAEQKSRRGEVIWGEVKQDEVRRDEVRWDEAGQVKKKEEAYDDAMKAVNGGQPTILTRRWQHNRELICLCLRPLWNGTAIKSHLKRP